MEALAVVALDVGEVVERVGDEVHRDDVHGAEAHPDPEEDARRGPEDDHPGLTGHVVDGVIHFDGRLVGQELEGIIVEQDKEPSRIK